MRLTYLILALLFVALAKVIPHHINVGPNLFGILVICPTGHGARVICRTLIIDGQAAIPCFNLYECDQLYPVISLLYCGNCFREKFLNEETTK